MAYELTVAGYTFQNPPEEYRKLARLTNKPQPMFKKDSTPFYHSDSQDLQLQVEGTLALNPPLGETGDDLGELEELQDLAISGGSVQVDFDPFFSGSCVIEDDPFRQQEGESSYSFTFTINSEDTDSSAYPSHETPDTGNTFELGDLDLGYDPETVQQNYERQTEKVKRLQGIERSVDTAGLVPKVKISGKIDAGGQDSLWQKARDNVLAYLEAEFQNGWVLFDSLSISNVPDAPDYLTGLFQYYMDLMVVMNPADGIGEVSSFADQEVAGQDEYVSDCSEDGIFERLGDNTESYPRALDYRVSGGTGQLNSEYIEWNEHFGTLDQSETVYIWIEDPDSDGYGEVNTGTSGFPGNSVPLYEVDTGSSSVNAIRDQRSCLLGNRLEFDEGAVGDLNFNTQLDVFDTIDYERLVRLSESLSITGTTLPWVSVFTETDTLAVTDGPFTPVTSITNLSDTFSLSDTSVVSSSAEVEVTASLNGGSIDLTVYEDTDQDGTADNQQQITVLDGTNTYGLDTLESGSDMDYWIQADFTAADIESTPTLETVNLTIPTGSSVQQNPRYQIQPAQFDTSGNLYEGGSVTAKYEG